MKEKSLLKFSILIFLLNVTLIFAENTNPPPVKFNSWELIIYRPENSEEMNDVRCWFKAEDAETGEDVTYTKIKAVYEWVANTITTIKDPTTIRGFFTPDYKYQLFKYKKTYYLSGGMAMHLNIKPGKYKFSVYTPKDKTNLFETSNSEDWHSNEFYYDTENPAKVIWVVPTANDNGFYNGGWFITNKAPDFYKVTKPER